ncbi:MAG: hypothetical protein WA945_04510 [Arcobacteraceae bacterium]
MNKIDYLKMPKNIKELELTEILDNLYFYSYHCKYLKKIQTNNIDKEDPHYISTYSSFIGEVYENVIYELLIKYAIQTDEITSFILKGPHQDKYENLKNGLMIDKNAQIVYKAGYKDVTEFDALFFTKDSVCFVESTIVKTTTSLRKRLKKKKALLEVLFPELNITALIILSEGAVGVNVFPKYCKVWVTDALSNEKLINDLIYHNSSKGKKFTTYSHKKLQHSKNVSLVTFKYFDTISWILRMVRKNIPTILDFEFLKTQKLERYFEIFSKFYIGHVDAETFVQLLQYMNIETISEDIPLNNIQDDQVVVTIEKTKESYALIYYIKVIGDKLKKLEQNGKVLVVSNKDPKGFTAAETKFTRYIFKKSYKFTLDDIKTIKSVIDLPVTN